jgi:PEP-CTERM motif
MDRPVHINPGRKYGRQRLTTVLLAVTLLAAVVAPVRADFVTFEVARSVSAQAMINNGTPDVDSVTSANVGAFNKSVSSSVTGFGSDMISSTASQSSNVPATGSLITASGSASFASSILNGSTGSVYDLPPSNDNAPNSTLFVLLDITAPQKYTATISLESSLSGNPGLFANTEVVLDAYAPDNGYVFVATAPATNQILTGVLQPGEYEFSVISELGDESPLTTNEFANSSYNVAFQLTPTPEPGSLVLLGVGVAAIGGYAWRRRKLAVECCGVSRPSRRTSRG